MYWFWIGVNDKETVGSYVYNSDNSSIIWSKWWNKDVPPNPATNCVSEFGRCGNSGCNYFWDRMSCNIQRSIVCEKDLN